MKLQLLGPNVSLIEITDNYITGSSGLPLWQIYRYDDLRCSFEVYKDTGWYLYWTGSATNNSIRVGENYADYSYKFLISYADGVQCIKTEDDMRYLRPVSTATLKVNAYTAYSANAQVRFFKRVSNAADEYTKVLKYPITLDPGEGELNSSFLSNNYGTNWMRSNEGTISGLSNYDPIPPSNATFSHWESGGITYNDGSEISSPITLTAVYTLNASEYEHIAPLLASDWDSSSSTITNPIYSCWNYGRYTIAKDETGCLMIYKPTTSEITKGTAIVNMSGYMNNYNGQAQYNLTSYETTTPSVTQTPDSMSLSDAVNQIGNPNGSVIFAKFSNVYFNTWDEDSNYYYLGDDDGDSEILIYNGGGTNPALNVDDNTRYDITGVVYRYNTSSRDTIQLLGQFPQTNGSGFCGFESSEGSSGDSGDIDNPGGGGAGWGDTETIEVNFSEFSLSNQEELTNLELNGVLMHFDAGTGSVAPKYFTSGTSIRLYPGNQLTISPNDPSYSVINVKFTFSSNYGSDLDPSAGELTMSESRKGTWSGSTYSVTFTNSRSSGTITISSFTATFTLGGITEPV